MLRGKSGFVLALVLIVGAFAFVMYSGLYNVAASDPHSRFARWVLDTVVARSVERRAEGLRAPALDDESRVTAGARNYDEACAGCHGAPGVEPMAFTRGLNPEPPHFTPASHGHEGAEWSAAELFWIVKHGIKMTGMPAWDDQFSDSEIWSLVAFLQAVPEMNADRYQQLTRSGGDAEAERAGGGASSAGAKGGHPG